MRSAGPPEGAPDPFETAACGLIRTRPDGTIVRVNRLFREWVGYPEEDLVGRMRLQELFSVGARLFHQTHWAPLLTMQGSVSEVKLELVARDGSSIPMILNARVQQHGESVFHEVAAFIVRDRDLYERELLLARKRLEGLVAEANELRQAATDRARFAEEMIGIVGHDLRTPLSVISMSCELLARADLGAETALVLDRVARANTRATRLVRDLLDFTRARIGQGLTISPQPTDLHETVAQIVEDLASTISDHSLRHERRGDGTCHVDVSRLAQVVGNLVVNAQAYGASDAPITVTSAIEDAACSVAVHNHGAPIPADIRQGIFHPMVRAAPVRATSRSVGLGLYIVRVIAEAHGGGVEVSSDAADGTTFTVTFPLCPDDEADSSSA